MADAGTRFDEWLTEHWQNVGFGALVLFGVSLALFFYILHGPGTGNTDEGGFDVPAATSTAVLPRMIDGVLVEESRTNLLPLGVIVENSADAWPLAGISRANLVFEAPVEGSITRLLAFYDASSTVDRIGPVRSARPYFVEWTDGLDGLLAHVGGSPAAIALINKLKSAGFRDLNEFFDAFFWRSNIRPMPHNTYTSTDLLVKGAAKRAYVAGTFRSFQYMDDVAAPATSTEQTVFIPFEGMYKAEFRYNPDKRDYIRYQNGELQKDDDGEWIRMKNVVVILTSARVLDREGRLDLRTTGEGQALLFRNGGKQKAIWKRTTGNHIRFETVDGLDATFARGSTWIAVMTSQAAFNKVVK